MLTSLPHSMRRKLRDAQSRIEALEGEMNALAERQRSLDDAIAEAGAGSVGGDSPIRSRRAELVDDLSNARTDVIARRERLAGVLENVRLQLLRVRSGVGSPADVSAELQTADVAAGDGSTPLSAQP